MRSAYSSATFSGSLNSGLLRQSCLALIAFPHTEGIDVDSERAAVDRGDAQRDEGHQTARQLAGLLDRRAERLHRSQDRRAMRHHLGGVEQIAEQLAFLGERLLQDRIAAILFDFTNAW